MQEKLIKSNIILKGSSTIIISHDKKIVINMFMHLQN